MLAIAIAFLCGNCWVQWLPSLHSPWLAISALVALLLLLTPVRRTVILAFLLGVIWVTWQATVRLQQDLAPVAQGQDIYVQGVIASIPAVTPMGVQFMLAVRDASAVIPPRISLTWYQADQIPQPGTLWQLTVRLKRRYGTANSGGYNYATQLFRAGIGATGYVRQDTRNQLLASATLRYGLLRLRAHIVERIVAALPDHPMQGLVRGLVVGDQQAISSAQWQVFARTGTSHLVAISGLHIGMVAALLAALGGCITRLSRAQQWQLTRVDMRALFGLLAALLYALLAGMSVPTQRTVIMISVYCVTVLLRRNTDAWHSFGVALLLVLWVDPFAPLSVGFWLSFTAVAVIMLSHSGRLSQLKGWRQYLHIQAIVTVGLLPPLLGAFGSISLLAPLVNVLAIPVFSVLVVPLVLCGTAVLLLSPVLGGVLLHCSAYLLNALYAILQWAAALPLAMWHFPLLPLWAMVLLSVGVLLCSAPLLLPMRFTGVLLCLPALLWRPAALPPGAFALTLLDVGQGLAVVIRTHAHTLLYDTGPAAYGGLSAGDRIILPYLHAAGVRQLDALLVSHGDSDHAGGMQAVLAGLPVKRFLYGPSVQVSQPDPSILSKLCQRGQQWSWDGVQFELLHPNHEQLATPRSDNNSSCVLRVAAAGGSALLLGDIERKAEKQLLAAQAIDPSTIVVAAHHGSRSSSTTALIAATQARYVLFSAGYRNRWGFPKADVVQRWVLQGALPYTTLSSGAVTLNVLPNGAVQVQEYRKQHRHYWLD